MPKEKKKAPVIKNHCQYKYAQRDVDIWGVTSANKPFPHQIGTGCKNGAIRGTAYCASHSRSKCPAAHRCTQVLLTVKKNKTTGRLPTKKYRGSLIERTGKKYTCKNCVYTGTGSTGIHCKVHTPGYDRKTGKVVVTQLY